MTLLRAAPREVYRMYDEDAFLAGAAGELDHMEGGEVASGSRIARAAGAVALLGVLSTIGTLIVLSGGHAGPARRRRPASASRLGAVISASRLSAAALRGPQRARVHATLPRARVDKRRAHSRSGRARRLATVAAETSPARGSLRGASPALGAPVAADASRAMAGAAGPEFGFEH